MLISKVAYLYSVLALKGDAKMGVKGRKLLRLKFVCNAAVTSLADLLIVLRKVMKWRTRMLTGTDSERTQRFG